VCRDAGSQRCEHRIGTRRAAGFVCAAILANRRLAAEGIQNNAHGSVQNDAGCVGTRRTVAIMPVARSAETTCASLDGAAARIRSASRLAASESA